ncbi:MAG TPA: nucleotidyltransferase domain-containing protein [Deltaproteobacteria bacterium]|nr:nucleotidyltransferase domain-containing protein [Deltaproteobacteria bacterium]
MKIVKKYDKLKFMKRPPSEEMELEALKPELHSLFNRYNTIRSAYLFGSMAAGIASERSDVDVAVRLMPGISPEDVYGIRLTLMDDLEQIFHYPADVLILNNASLKMIHQVFRYGISIYIRHTDEETEYRIRKQKAYFDFLYYIDKERLDMKEYYGA